jgi:hypothetical protein
MQTSVPTPNSLGAYSAGKCYRLSGLTLDLMALEDMPFGYGAVRGQVTNDTGRLPNMNLYVGELDADLVADDVVTFVGKTIEPDGTETTVNISVTYATSHASTAAAIETAIEADDSDIAVVRTNSNRTFTLTVGADKRLEVTTGLTVTSGGGGTAEFTNSKGSTDTIAGVSARDPNATSVYDRTYTEPTNEADLMFGAWYQGADPAVVVNDTIAPGDAAYCLLEDYTDQATVVNLRGTFRSDTDGDLAPVVLVSDAQFKFASSGGLAPLGINKP